VTARKKKPPKDDRLRPWDDRPISYERWVKHKDQIMASTRAGSRPEEWWEYEKQMPQPCDLGDERITLFEMVELTETELAELMPEWREEYEKVNEPNFSYCTGHDWLRGEAARRRKNTLSRGERTPEEAQTVVSMRAPPLNWRRIWNWP